ncbi:MAG: lysophospholipid acyltransferase family protein [Chitinophagales bacterium]|nr:lysophospholipid acyltransferase family protein [Chitinophagales bacterium]
MKNYGRQHFVEIFPNGQNGDFSSVIAPLRFNYSNNNRTFSLMKIVFRFFFTLYAYITFMLLMLIIFFIHVAVVLLVRKNRTEALYKIYRPWARTWAFINGVRLEVKGEENFEKDKSYVFVLNHGSTADIIIAAASMTNRYRPLGKKELTEIPFMGFMFKRAVVLVDRSDAESRRQSMERMRAIIKKNISIMIAPEGTRNRTPAPLQPFKDGAFRLAVEFHLPIVPMVLLNTRKLFPNNSLLLERCELKCHFLKPVPTDGLTENDIEPLKEKIYKMMEKYVLANNALFNAQPH